MKAAELDRLCRRIGVEYDPRVADLIRALTEACAPMLSPTARQRLELTAEAEEAAGSRAVADAIRFLLENEDRRRAVVEKMGRR